MWWKIYFWIMLILSLVTLISIYGSYNFWSLIDWLDVGFIILTPILFADFVYKKGILSRKIWFYIFWFSIVLTIVEFIYYFTILEDIITLPEILKRSGEPYDQKTMLFATIIALPLYYANYKLAYGNSKSN